MLIASAATLGRHHERVTSARQAARALRPLAGSLAARLFAAGLVISAVVALPVLLATTAYVVGVHFGWRRGLSEGIGRARGFYGVLLASTGLALAVSLAGIPVIGMLVAASIIGGFGTPVGLVLLVRLARDPQVMGEQIISRRLAFAGGPWPSWSAASACWSSSPEQGHHRVSGEPGGAGPTRAAAPPSGPRPPRWPAAWRPSSRGTRRRPTGPR